MPDSMAIFVIYFIFIIPGVYLLSYASLQFWVKVYEPNEVVLKHFLDNIVFIVDFAPTRMFGALHHFLLAPLIVQIIFFLWFAVTGSLLLYVGFLPLVIALSQGIYVNYLPVFILSLLTVSRCLFFGVRIKDYQVS